MTQLPPAAPIDYPAMGYQFKLHLLGISPLGSQRGLMRGDTTLIELAHSFQVAMGW